MPRALPFAFAFAFAFAVLCAAVPVRTASAAWPHDANLGFVPLSTTNTFKAAPVSVSDGNGGVIVVWLDYLASGVSDLYAQRIDASGTARWPASGLPVCTATSYQISPALLADGNGGVILAWSDQRAGNYDVYAQHLDASGTALWTSGGTPVCTAASNQQPLAIVSDGAGGAIITWTDDRAAGVSDVYAQRINAAGAPQWTSTGASVCTAAGNQINPALVSDGAGGAIVTWQDYRGGAASDIYVQRLNAAGAAQWTADGVAICAAANSQVLPRIVTDGAGGAIVGWSDNRTLTLDVWAQHLSPAGTAMWMNDGSPVCTASGAQSDLVMIPDDVGGAIFAWDDLRGLTGLDIYAQRISGNGATAWLGDGTPIAVLSYDQVFPQIASDGAGGAIIAWQDSRTSYDYDVCAQRISSFGGTVWTDNGVVVSTALAAQLVRGLVPDGANGAILCWSDQRTGAAQLVVGRVDRFGKLGDAGPAIASVKDVPADQGGRVKVSWYASYLDVDPYYFVDTYSVWRSAPPNLAARAMRMGARLLAPGEAPRPGETRAITTSIEGTQTIFWELVGTQVASADAGYSMVTATTSDSVAGANPRTLFRVQASATTGNAFWNSAADSGYSVDNLVPLTPAPFTGQYAAGTTNLFWSANAEADLAGYHLYRGSSLAFVPAPGNLVGTLAQTGYADAAGAPYVYKLTAFDAHGNESAPATLVPGGALAVDEATPRTLDFAAPGPNPARDAATFAFTLTRAGHARLVLFDAAGRHVRTLRDGTFAAGTRRETIALEDEGGHAVASGLYLVRLEAEGRVLTRRLAIVR